MGVTCRWVQENITGHSGEPFIEQERKQIEQHLSDCDNCRDLAGVMEKLAKAAPLAEPEPFLPLVERRIISAALEGRLPQRGTRRIVLRYVFRCAIAAAAIVVFLIGSSFFLSPDKDKFVPKIKTSDGFAVDMALNSTPYISASGSVKFGSSDKWLMLCEGTYILGDANTQITISESSALNVKLYLNLGKIDVDVRFALPGYRLVVVTPSGGEVEVRGTIFTVEVTLDGMEHVQVTKGLVEVRERGLSQVRLVEAGEQAYINEKAQKLVDERRPAIKINSPAKTHDSYDQIETPPYTGKPQMSGSERLVMLAREYRKTRQFESAAAVYGKLMDKYPGSKAAKNAVVALAQIELDIFDKPKAALLHFVFYLSESPSGLLSEEAWLGQVRALTRLGRNSEVVRVVNQYLSAKRRGSAFAEMLQRRGDANVRLGNCIGAVSDYGRIQVGWPGSHAALKAAKGLKVCGEAR